MHRIALSIVVWMAYGGSVEAQNLRRVACLGDSITKGDVVRVSYPAQLQAILGDGYDVKNYGVNAATLAARGAKPYRLQTEFVEACRFVPDIVVLMLGTNDSKAEDVGRLVDANKDLAAIVGPLRKANSKVVILVALPPVVRQGHWGIDPAAVQGKVLPTLKRAAKGNGLHIIDTNAPFLEKEDLWHDGVHPNQAGSDLIAQTIAREIEETEKRAQASAVKGKKDPLGSQRLPVEKPTPPRGKAKARSGGESLSITDDEAAVVRRCVSLIARCQLSDGAIIQAANDGQPGNPASIVPYFSHHAALALIEHADSSDDEIAMKRADAWINWCVRNQEKKGYWNHWDGTRAAYRRLEACDAHDSSCSMFLCVVRRRQQAEGDPTPAMVGAAKRCLACLETLVDRSGLTVAKSDYPVLYLMDNVESYAGLIAGREFFGELGLKDEQEQCERLAKAVAVAAPRLWDAEKDVYAWAMEQDGNLHSGLAKRYPDGLAQLFAIGHIRSDEALFAKTLRAFGTDHGPAPDMPVERVAVAASRLSPEINAAWRGKMVAAAITFDETTYSHRPAVVILALYRGADWLGQLPRAHSAGD